MSGSQAPGGPSLPPKPEAPTPPPPEESRPNPSPERPLIARLGPSTRPDSRDPKDYRERDERDRDRDRDRFYDRDRDGGRGRGRGRGFGRGGPPRRDYSPRRDDRRPPPYARDRSPPRRRDYSPPRRGAWPSYDDRRAGPYRTDYRDSRSFAPSSRRPPSPSWRQRDRSPRSRRSPPPYRARSRSRDWRRPSSRSPPRRSLSPRKVYPSRQSRSRSPARRRTPSSPRRSRTRSPSRSPPKAKCRLPPIGAPTGPRSARIVAEHPTYDSSLAAPPSLPELPPSRPVEMEPLELGQLEPEPEIVVKEDLMDVEHVKAEETAVSLPLAPNSDATSTNRASSPVPPPDQRHRASTPPSAMAIDEERPDIQHPPPVKDEPVQRPVKIEPSIPTRPRRFFDDHPPVNAKAERSSPAPKLEGRPYGREDRPSPAPSHLHVKDSPNSPRSPRFKPEEKFNEHSRRSSALPTPSIPPQELATSVTHSPRLPFDAAASERVIPSTEHKPSFMRMGPRTEHEHGRHPHPQREFPLKEKEKQVEPLYPPADLNDFRVQHEKRLYLERQSQAMACQLYTDMQELSLALLDLQSAQARSKLAAAMSELAKAGRIGIDYPSNHRTDSTI